MNIRVCDKNYIGNHVYNYLREYLFEHAGQFFVEQSQRPNLICHPNEIIWNSQKIVFPTPYGQYYGFYDNDALKIEPKTIFILNLCECVLKMILNEPYEELLESYLEGSQRAFSNGSQRTFSNGSQRAFSNDSKKTDKDRLNEDSLIIPARGGLCDNYIMWSYAIHCGGFLLVNSKYSGKSSSRQLECGQSNTNLLKFPFERLLTNVKPTVRNPYYKWSQTMLLGQDIKNRFFRNFSRPIAKTIDPKNFDRTWAMIGIRWFYVKIPNNSFYTLHLRIESLKEFIENHQKIVLVFDKYEFLKLFLMMFYDVLRGKSLAILNRFGINGVENTLKIASKCGDFWHTKSGFYDIIEGMNERDC